MEYIKQDNERFLLPCMSYQDFPNTLESDTPVLVVNQTEDLTNKHIIDGHLIDMTPEEIKAAQSESEKQLKIAEARQFLSDTDFYVVRLTETGKAIPEHISKLRELARTCLSDNVEQYRFSL